MNKITIMKLNTTRKLIIGTCFIILTGALATLWYFQSEINHALGAHTDVVDTTQFKTIKGRIAINSVHVLTNDATSMIPNQTILIRDHQIERIGTNFSVPDGYHEIDGSGKYLIPGLIDSHVHIKKSKNDLLLYLANGVTHVGEMTGLELHFDYRKEIQAGALGPDIYLASPKISSQDCMRAYFRSWFEQRHQNYTSTEAGRKAARYYHAMGYDALKMSSDLSKEIYLAINDEAQKLGIPVIGHLPVGLILEDLYHSGQSQLAHTDSIVLALMNEFGALTTKNHVSFQAFVEKQAIDIAQSLKIKGIAVSSTNWIIETVVEQDLNLQQFLKSIPLEYQNPGWIEGSAVSKGWLPGNNSYERQVNKDTAYQHNTQLYWQAYIKAMHTMTRALVNQGVTVTAGTDAHGASGIIAGFSLHKELESLNKLGLSEAQVLRMATSIPAQWMGIKTGVIAAGYQADLVLLNHNPLDDIKHTQSIEAVITNGQLISRQELDNILAAIKKANNDSREVSIDAYL